MEQTSVNAEQIMKEIRETIRKSGVYRDPLPFSDEPVQDDTADLSALIARLEEHRVICNAGDLSGNPAKRFLKKIVRKLTRFFVSPVAEDATLFNEAALQAIKALSARIETLEQELQDK